MKENDIMEEINHEYYVSLEVAKLLKKAGFDWKCRGIYVLDSENDPKYVFSTANFTNTSKEIEGYIRFSAPTLEVAQRWLREVKNIDVFVLFGHFEPKINGYTYEIRHKGTRIILSEWVNTTYEGAQEAGIKKALEILLEEGE